jgi:hypothetical protein
MTVSLISRRQTIPACRLVRARHRSFENFLYPFDPVVINIRDYFGAATR